MMAFFAGTKNCPMVDWAIPTRYTTHSCSGERTASSKSNTRPRSTSAVIITRCRFQRSTNTPATEPSSRLGSNCAANIEPVASAEPVMSYT